MPNLRLSGKLVFAFKGLRCNYLRDARGGFQPCLHFPHVFGLPGKYLFSHISRNLGNE